ncbi:hypothetical protein [Natrarchaeobaculum aegyptiacum]|uniref:Uncharacterized protein n=1 Tax=Natrarchaeobaculum aegyptiacum TaxID=745377 RepID=A0A2Z2HZ86_9EURY|nr:hypothetical protein [Natrarchaeobaculum aegyptiacum]ARS88978.1 hypothetical protein B1756_03890 [Natrarchaeobaculum aegyptiacum]
MERRRRLIVGALWIAVAGIMAITIDPTGPMLELDVIARLFVIVLALFLAVVYVFDPFGLYDYGNAE